jgi:glycosyltransferase involved in cell wall biosynthesis
VIRLLHIITRLDFGGSTENTIISMTRMAPGEFTCRLLSGHTVSPPPGTAAALDAAGVAWDRLPSLRREVHLVRDLQALPALERLIRQARPDIVHTHTSKAGFLGRLAARRARVPRIVHTPHGHVFGGYFPSLITRIFIALERRAARWTDRIITLSDEEARDHLRHGIGSSGQYLTIPSGVDLGPVLDAEPVRPVSGGPVIGTVARLVPIKGLEYLIDAAPGILREAPAARFLIVGDGELRPALAARARDRGVADRVHFTGYREDVPALIAGMDLFALPSLNEGMGRVLVMAMALGKPIVATRVGGVPELLAGGEAGLLVPPADPAALAEAICRLLRAPATASALGEAGRRRASRYSAESMVKALAELYRQLTGKR